MIYYIDRFEGNYAVLEYDGECFDFLREKLPPDAKEGDSLEWADDCWHILSKETDSRRQALAERRRKLLEGKHS